LSLHFTPQNLPAKFPKHELELGSRLIRFYDPVRGPWKQQRFYGPLPGMRFDHHAPPLSLHAGRSVWYAATSLVGAVSEAFGDAGFLDQASGRRICIARPRVSFRLLDLVGIAARAFRLDQRIGTDLDSPLCQEWSRAFYDRYPDFEGIRWRGRQAGSICIVLNDRANMDVLELLLDHDIAHSKVWPRIADAARRAHLRLTPP
jgi:hypothetical protein